MINQTLWIGTAAVVVGLVVRAINTDGMAAALTALRGGKPTAVPSVALPWLALFFGAVSAVLGSLVNGADWQTALAGGFVSAATAAFGSSLGKAIPGVRAVVRGRTARLGSMLLLLLAAMCLGGESEACNKPGASSPTVDAEAGVALVNDACDFFDGIDTSGTVRTICATVEEIAQAVGFILTIRGYDGGARPAAADGIPCKTLPRSTMCATDDERAKAIAFLSHRRAVRYLLDGGAR